MMKINSSNYLFVLLFFFILNPLYALEHHDFANDLPKGKDKKRNKGLKICVISDLNSSYGSTNYADEVKSVIGKLNEIKPDLILCAGDMVAGQKTSLTENPQADGFEDSIADPSSVFPVTIENDRRNFSGVSDSPRITHSLIPSSLRANAV